MRRNKIKEYNELEVNFKLGREGYFRMKKTDNDKKSIPKWLGTVIIQGMVTVAYFVIRSLF